jgi:hypothetical protein
MGLVECKFGLLVFGFLLYVSELVGWKISFPQSPDVLLTELTGILTSAESACVNPYMVKRPVLSGMFRVETDAIGWS